MTFFGRTHTTAIATIICVVSFLVILTDSVGDPTTYSIKKRKADVQVKSVLSGTVLASAKLTENGGAHGSHLAVKNQVVRSGDVMAVVRARLGVAVTARAPVSGYVHSVGVSPGDIINEGKVLFIIRPF